MKILCKSSTGSWFIDITGWSAEILCDGGWVELYVLIRVLTDGLTSAVVVLFFALVDIPFVLSCQFSLQSALSLIPIAAFVCYDCGRGNVIDRLPSEVVGSRRSCCSIIQVSVRGDGVGPFVRLTNELQYRHLGECSDGKKNGGKEKLNRVECVQRKKGWKSSC